MADVSYTQTVGALLVTTLQETKGEIVDGLFEQRPTLAAFKTHGMVEHQDGGEYVITGARKERNPTVGWTNRQTGAVSTQKYDPFTRNRVGWNLLTGTVWERHYIQAANRGEAAVKNALAEFIKGTKEDFAEEWESSLWTAQTGDAPYSILDLVREDPTTGTIGDINLATTGNPWFRNGYYNATGRSFAVYGENDMRDAWQWCGRYGKGASRLVVLAGENAWNFYADEVGDRHQIIDKKMADLGFPTMSYMGRPMVMCHKAPTDTMRFVAPGNVRITINSAYEMDMSDWIAAQDNIDKCAHILLECQLTKEAGRPDYCLFNIDTA